MITLTQSQCVTADHLDMLWAVIEKVGLGSSIMPQCMSHALFGVSINRWYKNNRHKGRDIHYVVNLSSCRLISIHILLFTAGLAMLLAGGHIRRC